ncbi:MAG: hypothetical protein G01um101470_942 [Parcubacteria group bacterium Gr01-1014_70]|nr:MAG: hypothetical protein G01um101470_942 [Parcubacteria group bacterium Gr01-1014_70]
MGCLNVSGSGITGHINAKIKIVKAEDGKPRNELTPRLKYNSRKPKWGKEKCDMKFRHKGNKKTWQQKLDHPNELPAPLTKSQRIQLLHLSDVSMADVEERYSSRSLCIRINGVWRQIG